MIPKRSAMPARIFSQTLRLKNLEQKHQNIRISPDFFQHFCVDLAINGQNPRTNGWSNRVPPTFLLEFPAKHTISKVAQPSCIFCDSPGNGHGNGYDHDCCGSTTAWWLRPRQRLRTRLLRLNDGDHYDVGDGDDSGGHGHD